MAVYTSIDQLIGNTPLLELSNIEKNLDLKAKVLVKLEYFNPAGSVKDRIAKAMLDDAEAAGKLNKDSVIIEPTSGNTGVGLASVAAARGYRLIITMPETMSVERRLLMKAYGAELVLTDGAKGMKGAIAKAEELTAEIPNSFIAGQFTNPANPQAHIKTTGPEIWNDTEGKVDVFVAGVGTGGTVTGVGKYLKSQNPDVKVVAVEPASSPVLSKGTAGAIRFRALAQALCPTRLTRASTMRLLPSKTTMRSRRAVWLAIPKAFSWAFRLAPLSGLRLSLPSAPKTRAKPSLPFLPTRVSVTSPLRCLLNNCR